MGKTRLFEALLNCFTLLAERSRVVVVFEDLHWADSASVEVIDFLARNLGASPLLLIGTYRRDELNQDQCAPSRSWADIAVSQLDLTGLDRDATAVLMAGILGHQPEWALLDAVHAVRRQPVLRRGSFTAARGRRRFPRYCATSSWCASSDSRRRAGTLRPSSRRPAVRSITGLLSGQ